jgi:hypothetical protein
MSFGDYPVFRTQPRHCSVKSSGNPRRLPRPFRALTKLPSAGRSPSVPARTGPYGSPPSSPPAFAALQRMRERGVPNGGAATPHRSPPVAYYSLRRTVPRSRIRRSNPGLSSHPAGSVSPRQRSWAFTYRASSHPKIGSASPRLLPPLPLRDRAQATARLRRLDPSEKPRPDPEEPDRHALMALIPSEAFPPAATPTGFPASSPHALCRRRAAFRRERSTSVGAPGCSQLRGGFTEAEAPGTNPSGVLPPPPSCRSRGAGR